MAVLSLSTKKRDKEGGNQKKLRDVIYGRPQKDLFVVEPLTKEIFSRQISGLFSSLIIKR